MLCKRKLSVEFGDLGVYDDHIFDVKVDNDGTWRFEWELGGDISFRDKRDTDSP